MREQAQHTAEKAQHEWELRSEHDTRVCAWCQATPTPCRFGYEEYDGARYCFEHGGFLEAGVRSRRCDRAVVIPPAKGADDA